MEREILFRGKRVDNGEWVEGHYCKSYGRLNGVNYDYHGIYDYESGDIYEVNPETRGEFTGLTDKNGRRIFEDDIVEYQGKRYVIKYLEKYMRFSPSNAHTVFAVFDYTQSEIIGNIHDDPELLGGEVTE